MTNPISRSKNNFARDARHLWWALRGGWVDFSYSKKRYNGLLSRGKYQCKDKSAFLSSVWLEHKIRGISQLSFILYILHWFIFWIYSFKINPLDLCSINPVFKVYLNPDSVIHSIGHTVYLDHKFDTFSFHSFLQGYGFTQMDRTLWLLGY